MTCPHADSDAAYVLGALDPSEQQDYRAHLVECARCSAAVEELAGMPGFLARLLPEADNALAAASPPSLVPRLAERVRAQRRIAWWRMVAAGAVLAVAAATAGVVLGPLPLRRILRRRVPAVDVRAVRHR